jgi:hypothetical protein
VTPVLHILIGALALAFGLLILRADPRRWDNRAFAALGVLDAATALFRGIASLFGASLLDPEVVIPCSLLAPLLAWATIEFAYSFPFARPMPWRWRAPLILWVAAALTVMITIHSLAASTALNLGFFIPVSVVFVVLQVRNLRRMSGDRTGVRLVLAALALRWLTANALYSLYGQLSSDTWALLVWVESTVVVLLSFLLIGLAVVRTNLFTARSAVGELLLEAAFVMIGLLLTGAGVLGAGKLAATWPRIERPLLMLSAAVPLLVYVGAERLRPRLERGVDPRRARRRDLIDAAEPALGSHEPATVATAATARCPTSPTAAPRGSCRRPSSTAGCAPRWPARSTAGAVWPSWRWPCAPGPSCTARWSSPAACSIARACRPRGCWPTAWPTPASTSGCGPASTRRASWRRWARSRRRSPTTSARRSPACR